MSDALIGEVHVERHKQRSASVRVAHAGRWAGSGARIRYGQLATGSLLRAACYGQLTVTSRLYSESPSLHVTVSQLNVLLSVPV